MAKLKVFPQSWGSRYYFHCPGCGGDHSFDVRTDGHNDPGHPCWTFNGNLERPSFSPSIRILGNNSETQCHLFINDGKIQFLADCKHSLAGQTVDLPDVES